LLLKIVYNIKSKLIDIKLADSSLFEGQFKMTSYESVSCTKITFQLLLIHLQLSNSILKNQTKKATSYQGNCNTLHSYYPLIDCDQTINLRCVSGYEMGYLGKCQCNEHYSFDLNGSKNCSLCSSGYAKASTTNDGICCKKQKENKLLRLF
jgi:hypothetical protein